jgi:hypothetical protein
MIARFVRLLLVTGRRNCAPAWQAARAMTLYSAFMDWLIFNELVAVALLIRADRKNFLQDAKARSAIIIRPEEYFARPREVTKDLHTSSEIRTVPIAAMRYDKFQGHRNENR